MGREALTRWSTPASLVIVGLDLAWSETNPSGASVARWDGSSARLEQAPRADLGDNRQVLRFVRDAVGRGPSVVAIDCPLAVPNPHGRRVCDALISAHFRRFHAGTHPANRSLFERKNRLRGERLAAALQTAGFSLDPRRQAANQVVEVYPHPAIVSLFDLNLILKYKAGRGRPIEYRRRELGRLQTCLRALSKAQPSFVIDDSVARQRLDGLSGTELKAAEDSLDSIVCAYTGLLYGLYGPRRCAIFGDFARGHIVIPMNEATWHKIGKPVSPDILYTGDRPPNA